jgi:hypothetical protein
MNSGDFPAPKEGFLITHVLVAADLDRSREFYRSMLGGQVPLEGDPVIIKAANTVADPGHRRRPHRRCPPWPAARAAQDCGTCPKPLRDRRP